ncbi:glutamate racemase [Planococcus lenghuensis]|uniref:Glutamate racemase n=1 Tax=Planococcus lenghuensis TaxID=2213202 RepID=A0A1Q2KYI0_9BACL|nr:glutamate racemase [Planococcus lenghuensis]AQQ52857.1 glutamate racemase [Planococcus lenghuensis]
MNAPIGVMDSGVGGLTVAKEIIRLLPAEQVVYIGDNARCPYGPRPFHEVRKYTWQLAEKLMQQGVKMIVIACNTATAAALKSLQKHLPIPVIGVIFPGARAAIKASATKKIVVLGTNGTIESGAYEHAIKSLQSASVIIPLACPKFVPLVESREHEGEFARRMVTETLAPIKQLSFDTAILGCTHYPLLQPFIEKELGERVTVLSSAAETARDAKKYLEHEGTLADRTEPPKHIFYTTGSVPIFRETVSDWLQLDEPDVRTIRFI